jgi:ribosome biogenesis GTPase
VRVERTRCFAIFPDGHERPVVAGTLPAVGDWVVARDGALVAALPRWSELTRIGPDAAGPGTQVLAANIDTVFIAVPGDRLNPARAERELAVAWDSGAEPIVVLTKSDLAPVGGVRRLMARLVGATIVEASARTGQGLADITRALAGYKTAVLLGPSGAGKSTLVNALLGSDAMAVGQVRDDDGRGRHTTSRRQLVPVPGGGVLIDTPGLRSLGLAGDVSTDKAFADIAALAQQCQFGDCRHDREPGCAVNEAVQNGTLDKDRLGNFAKLEGEIEADRRRYDPRAGQEHQRAWKQRAKQGQANRRSKQG